MGNNACHGKVIRTALRLLPRFSSCDILASGQNVKGGNGQTNVFAHFCLIMQCSEVRDDDKVSVMATVHSIERSNPNKWQWS